MGSVHIGTLICASSVLGPLPPLAGYKADITGSESESHSVVSNSF